MWLPTHLGGWDTGTLMLLHETPSPPRKSHTAKLTTTIIGSWACWTVAQNALQLELLTGSVDGWLWAPAIGRLAAGCH